MRTRHQQFLLFLLLFVLLPTTLTAWLFVPARAATLQVPLEYPTIQAAVNAAGNGDVIEVDAGTYPENVVVNKTVTIQGIGATSTIIDGGGNDIVFYIQEDDVELRDLTICNGGIYGGVLIYYPYNGLTVRNTRIMDNAVGIVVSEVNNNLFENNIMINNQMYGIDLLFSSNTIIRDNQISESAYGIEVSDSSNCEIVNNTISEVSYGIYVPYSNGGNISANTLSSNSWNIYLTASNSNVIGFNSVSGGAVGIQVMHSEGNSVLNNTVGDSSYGIYLGYSGANTVSGNVASMSDWGIELYNTAGSTVIKNRVQDSAWGFWIAADSDGNSIYHNNLFDNAKGAYQEAGCSNTWRTPSTPYQGNYWSNYKGQDTNGDGVGDTYVPWEGVDWYPLITPYGVTHDVAVIDVAAEFDQAYVGEIINITVTAENQGNMIESFNVTAKYENTTYAIYQTVGTQEVIDLLPDQSIVLTFTWNTTDTQTCVNYTVKAEASIVTYEVDTIDNTYTDGTVKVKIIGDVNGDGIVDITDLTLASMAFGIFEGEPGYNREADVNRDGIVDMRDLSTIARLLGNTC